MTHIQKAKEIIKSFGIFTFGADIRGWDEWFENWITEPEAAAILSGEDWKEDADSFAIAFAAWCIGPEGEMYRASGVSASKLLQLYKDRPYINTDPKIN